MKYLFLLFFMLNCISTYRDYPIPKSNKLEIINTTNLQYHIVEFEAINNGGYEALTDFFKNKVIFKNTERISEKIPQEGYYLKIKSDWQRITGASAANMYISLISATIIPAWSNKDGYDVKYSLYKDGKKIKDFDYRIRRSIFIWLFTLPVIWINLFTDTEADTFRATAYQFANDVKPFFINQTPE